MKKCKKALLLALSTVLIFSMAACGKKDDESKNQKVIDKEHVFKETNLTSLMEAAEITEIQYVVLQGNRVYMSGSYYTDDYSYYDGSRYASVNLDGTDPKHFSLSQDNYGKEDFSDEAYPMEENADEEAIAEVAEEDVASNTEEDTEVSTDEDYWEGKWDDYDYSYENYGSMNVTEDGHFLLMRNSYSESYVDEEWVSENTYAIVEFDEDGNLLSEVEILPEGDKEDYYSVGNLVKTENGKFYMVEQDTKVTKLGADYQRVSSVELEGVGYISDIYVSGSSIYVSAWDSNYENMNLYELKDGATSFSEAISLPSQGYNGSLFQGSGSYDFYICTDKELKGWNIGDADVTEVLDFIDSDSAVSYVDRVFAISDEDLLVVYTDSNDWKTRFSEFKKVAPEDVKDKIMITLGCHYLDYQVKKQVIEYNKTSDSYRIQIVDYSDYDTYEDYNAGITKMNNDIAAGNIPDIFILADTLPIDSYVEKGLFDDLTKYVEKEDGMSMDQFAPNIVKAYSEDGKWYCLVPSFYIQTYGAKESLVGEKTNWSIQDAMNVLKSLPEDSVMFEQKTRSDILREGLNFMGKYFVDWKTGTCRFDSEEFAEFLEFAKMFPEEIDWDDDEYWDEYWNSYETMYRNNKTLLLGLYMSNIAEMNYQEQGKMGEKISFVGFPTISGTGSYIVPNVQLALSAKSSVKEGAWDFFKVFLSDEYQLSDDNYCFPITMKGLEKLVEKAQERPFYYDEEGNKVEYDDTYYFDGGEITIKPFTEERAREILDFVLSVDQHMMYDDEISNLISEEAESFFKGQKSAKEVADIIQSRAQIYVNEHM